MESRGEVVWFTVAVLSGCALAILVQRGLSESSLIWLEVFAGVSATVLLFIYRDRDRLAHLLGRRNLGLRGK